MIGRDGWAGVVVLAFCAVLWWLTLGIRGNPLVPIGPEFYPRIVIGVTAALAAALVLADVMARRAGRLLQQLPARRLNYALVAATFAVFGAYVIALPWLGFRVATFIYVLVAAAVLAWPRDAKGWATIAALALGTTIVTYLVFERYLTVLLPRGKWTGF
jgi:putative tricarboxylic transport membrane protein